MKPDWIMGVALPDNLAAASVSNLGGVVIPSTDFCGVKTLKISPDSATYSHVHLVQSRKRHSPSQPSSIGDASVDPPLGRFVGDSEFRVVGCLSHARVLAPAFDNVYRKGLKARQESVMRPGN